MKTYRGAKFEDRNVVTIDGKVTPNGHVVEFTWGEQVAYQGPSNGAECLSRLLLRDSLGYEKADALFCLSGSGDFAQNIVARLEREWEITSADIEEWLAYTCGTSQSSAVTPPRLVENPNYRLLGDLCLSGCFSRTQAEVIIQAADHKFLRVAKTTG